MTLHQLAAALAAALLLTTSPGFGATWEADPSARRACTPELQKCLEKLELRLQLHGRIHDGTRLERALLELQETDPECALMLRDRGLHGF